MATGQPWCLHPSRIRVVSSTQFGYACRLNRATGGERTCTSPATQSCRLLIPPVGTVAAPCGSPAVPHFHRYYEALRLLAIHPRPPPVSLGGRYLPGGRRWRALLGSWRIPLEACP